MKKLTYIILVLLMAAATPVKGQSPCGSDGLCAVQFNAGFNEANKVTWIDKLNDCDKHYIDISVDASAAGKYKIVVVPTIIVFNGKEVKRFQADISFAMKATKSEVQEVVDEILMDQF